VVCASFVFGIEQDACQFLPGVVKKIKQKCIFLTREKAETNLFHFLFLKNM